MQRGGYSSEVRQAILESSSIHTQVGKVADYGDKKQRGILLTPQARAWLEDLAKRRTEKIGVPGVRVNYSTMIALLIEEEAKREGLAGGGRARANGTKATAKRANKKRTA